MQVHYLNKKKIKLDSIHNKAIKAMSSAILKIHKDIFPNATYLYLPRMSIYLDNLFHEKRIEVLQHFLGCTSHDSTHRLTMKRLAAP